MSKKAGPGPLRLLYLLPALFIVGAVGSLFVVGTGGNAVRPASAAAGPAKPSQETKPKASGRSGVSAPAGAATPAAAPKADSAALSLRVLSWNLRDCAATDGKTGERLALHEPIAEVLASLRPDIAAFEEIQQDDEKGGDIALLQVALAKAGWAMPYQTSIETGGQDDIALFSREPILSSEAVLEPGPSDSWPRPGLHAVVDAQRAKLDVFVFHFKAMPDKDSEFSRKAQAKAVADLIRRDLAQGSLSSLAVVAGDFNTDNPGDRGAPTSTLGFLELKDDADPSNDFTDAIESLRPQVPTFVDSRYRSVLDHLILSPQAASALKPGSALVYKDIPSVGSVPISDHRPVLVELALYPGK
jgi:endonuclease/exonuclease/phosphatase family metal-dependent hydrolase